MESEERESWEIVDDDEVMRIAKEKGETVRLPPLKSFFTARRLLALILGLEIKI